MYLPPGPGAAIHLSVYFHAESGNLQRLLLSKNTPGCLLCLHFYIYILYVLSGNLCPVAENELDMTPLQGYISI